MADPDHDWREVTFAEGIDPPKRWGDGSGELVLLAPTTGPGLTNEHVYDSRAWYVQILGPQGRDLRVNDVNHRTEALAWAVDAWILFRSPRPLDIVNERVGRVQRFGSMATPTALGSSAQRPPWSATYVFDTPTGLR